MKDLSKIKLTRYAFLVFFTVSFMPVSLIFAHETPDSYTIHINEDGFSPERLVVKPHTKVIFENNRSGASWPASNDHPSHTLYDGTSLETHCATENKISFDACAGIAPNDSWGFTFEKVGIYPYHDHYDSFVGGVVIVRQFPLQNFIREFMSHLPFQKKIKINETNFAIDSYKDEKQKYTEIVNKKDPRIAIETLKKDSLENPEISSICHDLLHVIGRTAYEKYGSFEKSVVYHQDFCNSGYIHGLFEVYFQKEPNPLPKIGSLCIDRTILPRGFDVWQCQHGIGHGLMYFTQGDLDESIRLCEESLLSDGASNCTNGAYMEVFNSEVLAKEEGLVNRNDPFKTCKSRNKDKTDCFIYVPVYLHGTLGMDFDQIIEKCTELGGVSRDSCVLGVGSELMKRNMNDERMVLEVCNTTEKNQDKLSCIAGAASMIMNQKGSFEAGSDFCDVAPEDYRVSCHSLIENKRVMFE